jgi:hypothetical protein
MYENPSADKFGPPPDPTVAKPDRKRRGRGWRLAVIGGTYAAAYLLNARGRGWMTALSAVALLVSTAMDYLFSKHPDDDADPYSPPTNITR